MGKNQTENTYEEKRLKQTISFAKEQLRQAKAAAQKKKSGVLEAKKDVRENATHSVTGLYTADGFEALVELSQYLNPVISQIADYEEEAHKISLLENMIKSPYFARIDFKFDDEDEFENIYIGRSSLKNPNNRKMCVYDWRSPIASVFYRFMAGKAFYDAPCGRVSGELGLKRQYEIKNGNLAYFFDADVQIVDEFLRQLLSQNASTKMRAIVETIQQEQDAVIRDLENDLLMVQGVAGSGKTSIALHRAAYLMYQGLREKLSANQIMIISPNSIFEQYISDVLPELGEDNVVSATFDELLHTILKGRSIQSRNAFLETLLVGSPHKEVLKASMELKTSRQFQELLDRFLSDIPERWIAFDDISYEGACVIKKQALKDKILARAETPLGVKLGQLQNMITLDVVTLYQQLFSDEAYFYSLLREEPSESIKKIWQATRERLSTGCLHYDDAIAVAYLHLKIYGATGFNNIKHVVIDEAQDYSPLQYEIFRLLCADAKFTVLGDINQTLVKNEDLSLYGQIQRTLNKKKSSLIILSKSFRCTKEILNYSLTFLDRNPEIKSFNRSGERPEVFIAENSEELLNRIVDEVNRCQEKGLRSIGLLCKTEKNAASFFQKIKGRLDVQWIRDGSASGLQGVFLIPIYLSKGLEFDAAILCDADSQNYRDEDDRHLFYVACTRALHRLRLFCEKEVSPLAAAGAAAAP